jgi:hypothetical protein
MRSPAREIFLWRAVQLTVVPPLGLTTAVLALGLLPHDVAYPAASLSVGLGVTVGTMTWWCSRGVRQVLSGAALAILLGLVLLLALPAQLLWRQTASFPKVATSRDPTMSEASP